MIQSTQILGALLILAAFAMLQSNRVTATNAYYLLANLLGSSVLAVLALIESQWGFLLLEGAWAIVSGVSLVRRTALRGKEREHVRR